MSDKNNTKVCSTCGTRIDEGAKFCPVCGSKQQEAEIAEIASSAEQAADFSAEEATASADSSGAALKKRNIFINKRELIYRIISFAIAVLLMLMAAQPIVELGFEVEDDVYTSVGIGATEVITFGVDAVNALLIDETELAESDIVTEYAELLEAYPEKIGPKVSEKENKLFEELWFYSMRVAILSGATVPVLDIAPAVVAYAIYLLACITYLVSAFVGLVRTLLGKPKPSDKTVRKAIFAAAMMPLCFFTVSAFSRFGIGGDIYSLFGLSSVMASGAFSVSLVAAFGYLALLCVDSALHRRGGLNKRYFVKSIALCVTSFIVVISLFMPFVTSNISVKVDGKRIKENASAYSYSFSMMERDEGRYYNGSDTDEIEYMLTEAAVLLKKGKLDSGELKMLEELTVHSAIATDNAEPYMILYPVSYCVSMLALVFSLALAMKSLRRFLGVEKNPRSIVVLKIFNLCSVIAYFVLSTLLAMSANNLMEYAEIEKLCYTRIGIGPDIALVVSVLMLFIVFKKGAQLKAKQYDEPDVSYTPYNF